MQIFKLAAACGIFAMAFTCFQELDPKCRGISHLHNKNAVNDLPFEIDLTTCLAAITERSSSVNTPALTKTVEVELNTRGRKVDRRQFVPQLPSVPHVTAVTNVVVVDIYPTISTSTLYSTSYVTVFACPETVTECPLHSQTAATVTSVIPVSISICPITSVSYSVSPSTYSYPVTSATPLANSTSTVYITHAPASPFPSSSFYAIPSSSPVAGPSLPAVTSTTFSFDRPSQTQESPLLSSASLTAVPLSSSLALLSNAPSSGGARSASSSVAASDFATSSPVLITGAPSSIFSALSFTSTPSSLASSLDLSSAASSSANISSTLSLGSNVVPGPSVQKTSFQSSQLPFSSALAPSSTLDSFASASLGLPALSSIVAAPSPIFSPISFRLPIPTTLRTASGISSPTQSEINYSLQTSSASSPASSAPSSDTLALISSALVGLSSLPGGSLSSFSIAASSTASPLVPSDYPLPIVTPSALQSSVAGYTIEYTVDSSIGTAVVPFIPISATSTPASYQIIAGGPSGTLTTEVPAYPVTSYPASAFTTIVFPGYEGGSITTVVPIVTLPTSSPAAAVLPSAGSSSLTTFVVDSPSGSVTSIVPLGATPTAAAGPVYQLPPEISVHPGYGASIIIPSSTTFVIPPTATSSQFAIVGTASSASDSSVATSSVIGGPTYGNTTESRTSVVGPTISPPTGTALSPPHYTGSGAKGFAALSTLISGLFLAMLLV